MLKDLLSKNNILIKNTDSIHSTYIMTIIYFRAPNHNNSLIAHVEIY